MDYLQTSIWIGEGRGEKNCQNELFRTHPTGSEHYEITLSFCILADSLGSKKEKNSSFGLFKIKKSKTIILEY